MIDSANEQLSELKRQLIEQQEADQGIEEQQSEEIVEDSIDEHDEEEYTEEDQYEEDVQEPQDDDEQLYGKTKNAKELRKRIEGNYREKLKERDDEMKALKDQIQQMQVQMAEQKGRQDAMMQPEPVDSDPEPDALLDPEEHTAWKLRQYEQKMQEMTDKQQEQQALLEYQRDLQAVQSLEAQYESSNSDVNYRDAENFVREREKRMLKIQHPQATDAQIDEHIAQQKMALFKQMAAQGQNATEVIVQMAKEAGFTSEITQKKQPNFEAIKRNQKKNASLIGGSDATRERGVTPEQLLSMSMNELISGGADMFKKAHKNIR